MQYSPKFDVAFNVGTTANCLFCCAKLECVARHAFFFFLHSTTSAEGALQLYTERGNSLHSKCFNNAPDMQIVTEFFSLCFSTGGSQHRSGISKCIGMIIEKMLGI